MADQPRGRGRGRGRARGAVPTDKPPEHQGPPPQRQQPPPHATASIGRAGLPRGQPLHQQQQAGPGGPSGVPGRAVGHAAYRGGSGDPVAGVATSFRGLALQEQRGASSAGAQAIGGTGDSSEGRQVGRGALRGNRPIQSVVKTRPDTCVSKHGTTGTKINLMSNYFEILTKADWCLYQYRVDFNPEEDRTIVRRGLLAVHKNTIGAGYIFDGTVLFTHRRLVPDPLTLVSQRQHDEAKITITVKEAGTGGVMKGDPTYLQVYNIVIRKCLKQLNLQLLGRNYFDPKARIIMNEHKLELWPGYITSMRQHEYGVLLCVEITHKVLRRDTALDLLNKCMQGNSRDYQNAFSSEILGQVVLCTYGNTATYRIDDVDFKSSPESTFNFKGNQTSYIDYYKQKYGANIRNRTQPMLISMPKARDRRAGKDGPIYLVPELCQMTGLTDEMRSNLSLMREMAEHTRMSPGTRQSRLALFEKRFSGTREIAEEMKIWNLKLAKNIITLPARVLPCETIVFGNGARYGLDSGPDWTTAFRNNKMVMPGVLDRWVVISPIKCMREIQGFVQQIQNAGRGMDFRIDQPRFHELHDDRTNSCVQELEYVLSKDMPKLVMFVVANNRADRYSAIKKKTYVDRAVPSQVLCARTTSKKGSMSIATKIAIQLSCKIGGCPWTVDIPTKGIMVVGYDVCHEKNKSKSFGAMVASLNNTLSRYYSTVTPHTSGDELFSDLPLNMEKALNVFKRHNNGMLPSRIIIYRDGVGEGQLHVVRDREVEAVISTLNKVYGGKNHRTAFVVVTKRLNSRFFSGPNNPPAGSVVDDVVTCPEKYDFFLVSQSVRQGSVSPTGYNVIYDESNLDADKMQRLAYKMTHLYFNWTGTVRVPAPCQYAHKLAFMCGQNLLRSPNMELEDFLYFL